MKYAFAAVAFAAIASAQTIADIPSCARPVLEKAIADNTDCEVSDLACVCKSFDSVQGAATAAILKACGAETALNEVLPAAEKLCANPPKESASAPAEEEPASTATSTAVPAEETTAAAAPSDYPSSTLVEVTTSAPVEEPVETPSEEPTVVVPPVETPSGGETTPVPTAGAATLGSMGALAMVVLGAFAL